MYSSVDEMNQELVKSINSLVKEDDTLYHLGDWSFGGKENIWNFRKQLRCQNIHLILGNHDHHIEENKILPNCRHSSIGWPVDGKPEDNLYGTHVFPEQLFSSVSHYKEVNINGQAIILSHYPFAVWHGNGKGWWHLHGHCHSSFKSIGKSMDVGIDNAILHYGFPVPFSYSEIKDIMDKKGLELLDHHGPSTNTGKIPK
jgi:calcineurin-like phosphoesterase family protein